MTSQYVLMSIAALLYASNYNKIVKNYAGYSVDIRGSQNAIIAFQIDLLIIGVQSLEPVQE